MKWFLLALSLLLLSPAFAQKPPVVAKIGFLAPSSPKTHTRPLAVFLESLRERGLEEGKNLTIERRWTDDDHAGLPRLAAELVALKVDVILAWTTPAVLAAKQATAAIPIVMVGVGDPVASGLVASLAHSGNNVTGVTNLSVGLSGKLVEMLVQVVPGKARFAGVRNVQNPSSLLQWKETEAAMRALGLQMQPFDVRRPADLEPVFAAMAKARVTGVVFLPDSMFVSQRERIAALAVKHRLPSVFGRRENAEAGGLISYGPDLARQFQQAASYVEKILKGAKPGDLPIDQPRTLDLVVNLKTARALGVTIPQSVLLRADKVIE